MTSNRLLFISVLLISCLFSCKKDKSDDVDPVITISTPTDGQAFNVLDFITVSADVSDDQQLSSISVCVLDDHYMPVQNAVEVTVGSKKSMTFTKSYQLYDIRLESGIYFIWVAASDGKNIANAYQRIDVTAVPKKLKGIYALAKSSSVYTSVTKIDSAYNVIPIGNYISDYGGSSISAYEQSLFFSGYNTGDTKAIDVENGSVKWAVPYPLGPAPHCQDNYYANRITYVSYRSGAISGYNESAINYFSASAVSGYYPEKIFRHNTYMLSEQRSLTTGIPQLVVYLSTGVAIQQQSLAQDVVAMFKRTNNETFVFGNDATNHSAMEIYDISGNSFWSPHAMPANKLLSVEQVDTNTYILGFDNNTIYKYTYHNNSLLSYLTGVKPVCMRYNEVDNEMIIADDTKVWCYDFPSVTFKNSASLSDSIRSIQLLYNR